MHKKNSIQVNTVFRAKLIGLVFLLLAILLVVQIIHIQFIDTAKYKNNFEGRIIRVKEIEAPRGTIYAQDGRTLAVDIPHYDLHFDATAVGIFDLVQQKKIQDSLQAMSEYLHRIFPDKPTNGYLSLFQAAIAEKSKFKLLQKNISYAQYEQLKEMPLAARGKNKGGLIFVQKTKRYLPQGELAKRTIGYTNDKGNSVGLEHSFSKILSGEKGLQKQKRVGASIWLPLSDDYVHRPQKGADISAVKYLDNGLKHFYGICSQLNNTVKQNLPGAGAAGGLGYGTSFFLGASLKSGIDLILKYSNIEKFIPEADLVITGEGALDKQTLQGKLIKGVCQMAKKYNKPVIAICGALDLNSEELTALGLKAAFSISQGPGSLNDALLSTEKNLTLTAFNIAQILK